VNKKRAAPDVGKEIQGFKSRRGNNGEGGLFLLTKKNLFDFTLQAIFKIKIIIKNFGLFTKIIILKAS
jgi:hypothetical protein